MADELKIRIPDWQAAEAELLRRGAVFREERRIVDTYFNQPLPHHVLKIQRDQHNDWLVDLRPKDGKFQIVKFEKITNADSLQAELEAKHGIMSVLRKRCRFYDWRDYVVDLNIIEEYGDFLVLTGEAPTPALLAELGFEDPELIRVPFNELPKLGAPTTR